MRHTRTNVETAKVVTSIFKQVVLFYIVEVPGFPGEGHPPPGKPGTS